MLLLLDDNQRCYDESVSPPNTDYSPLCGRMSEMISGTEMIIE